MSNNQNNILPFYRQSVDLSLQTLGSSKTGLNHQQAAGRLQRYGPNILQAAKEESVFK